MNRSIRKHIAVLLLSGLLSSSLGLSAYGADTTHVFVNGVEKVLSAPIIEMNGTVLVSLSALAEATAMQVNWNGALSAIECSYNGMLYTFKAGSTLVRTDTFEKSLSYPVQLIQDRSYIPLNAVTDVFGGSITLDNNTYQIQIYTDSGKPYGQYTFDDLYALALKNSIALRQAQGAYEKAEITYDEENDDYFETPSNNGDPTREAVRLANLLTMRSTEISMKTAEISTMTVKDQIRYELQDLLNDGRVAEGALMLAEEDLAVQRMIQSQNEVKYVNGLLSLYEYEKATETLKTKELAYATKKSERDALLVKLDNILMLGIDQYTFLKHSGIPYEPLADRNVDAHVQSIISESPDIWSLEQVIKLKEYNVDYFVFNAGQIYETAEIDVTTAKQNVTLAKQNTEVSVRQLFEQLSQMENSYSTLLAEREKLDKDLQVAQLNYSIGLTTKLAVEQVKLAYSTVDQQILSLKGSYSSLKAAYLQPWAVN